MSVSKIKLVAIPLLVILGCVTQPARWAHAQAPEGDKETSGEVAKPDEAPGEEPGEEPAEETPAKPEGPVAYLTLPYVAKLHKDYKDSDKSEDQKAKKLRDDMRRFMDSVRKDERGDSIKDDQTARKFDNYYTQFFFAQMTLPERVAEFAKDRQEFFTKELGLVKSKAVHDRLVDLAYRTMLSVAQGNYHPAARYNAMLIIGELNSEEAVRGGSSPAAPEPLTRPALGALIKELESPAQIDPVRVACLVGILRHAEMDGQKQDLGQRWDPPVKTKVVDTMLALLNAKEPPKGRSAEGHVWMQRRAIDVLGAIGDNGAEGVVAKKLESMIADIESPLSLRCSAAVALGQINSLAASKIDPGEASQKLAELALQAGKFEIARLEAEKKSREDFLKHGTDDTSKGGGGFGPGGMAPGGMRPGGVGSPGGMRPGGAGGPGGMRPGGAGGIGPGAGGAGGPGGLKPGGAGGVRPGGAGGAGAPPGIGPGGGGAGTPPGVGPGAGGAGGLRPGGVGGPRGFQGGPGGAGPIGPGGAGAGGVGRPGGAGVGGLGGAGAGGVGRPGGAGVGGLGGAGAGGVGRPGGIGGGGLGGIGGGGVGGGGYGGFNGSESDAQAIKDALEYREKYKLEVSCRRLRHELYCVKLGLEGTPSRPNSGLKNQFARDPYKPYVEKLVNSIDEIGKVIEKTDPKLETLLKDLKAKVADLEKLAASAPTTKKPEAAPAETPAEEPDGPDGPDGPPPPVKAPADKPAAPADAPDAPGA